MNRNPKTFQCPAEGRDRSPPLAGKEAVSNLADELKSNPAEIHAWVKQVLDQAEQAFDTRRPPRGGGKDRKIAALEEKLVKKNEVVAELMEEHVQLKKELGEL